MNMNDYDMRLIWLMIFMFYICYKYPKNTPLLVLNICGIPVYTMLEWTNINEAFGVICLTINVVLNAMMIFSNNLSK